MTEAGKYLISDLRTKRWSMTDLFMLLSCKPDLVLDLVFDTGYGGITSYKFATLVAEELGRVIGPNAQFWIDTFLADRRAPGAVVMIENEPGEW